MIRTKPVGVTLGRGQLLRLQALEARFMRTRSELVREAVDMLLRAYEREPAAQDPQVIVN